MLCNRIDNLMAEILDFKTCFQNLVCCLSIPPIKHDQTSGYLCMVSERSYS